MKRVSFFSYLISSCLLIVSIVGLCIPLSANAELPTATIIADEMTIGWNIGNSLEVPDGETAWGNPMVTQQLVDAVSAAGFNTIRIPCAWNSYADQDTLEIDSSWLARVKEVVDYGYANGMYIILNSHWDGGWLEENPFYSAQDEVNEKQAAYWTQIANYFKDYDEHLLFAGTNEVRADYGNPTDEYIEVQQSYLQTFVEAVRSTGGNNASRTLIVQTYNTNIWFGLEHFTLPDDTIEDRLMVEVHHYDPYDFTLNTNNTCIYWGSPYPSQSSCSWAQESYIDDLFSRVNEKWTANGIPVVMGEYGAIKRTSLNDADAIASRNYWLTYNTAAAIENGVIPVYWDNGYNGDNGFALFDRSTGGIVDQEGLDALLGGAGDPNQTYTLTATSNGSGSVGLDPSGGSYQGGTVVQITAQPDTGWDFLGWSGDLDGDDNPASITMNSNITVTANFIEEGASGSGTILREYWTNISGITLSDLTSNEDYPDNPSGSEQITSLEGPTDWDDIYGTRIRGYIHPPMTGSYTFWVAGDDYTALLLSTDDDPANANQIAYVNGWTNSREWSKYASQESSPVQLTAGEGYYVEVLHKEGYGGDNIAVAWEGPGISQSVIQGTYLSPYEGGNGSIAVTGVTVSPTSASLTTGESITLSATVTPSNATNQNVTWASSDNSVATVNSNGVVTAVSAYDVTITATTQDGGYSATSSISISVHGLDDNDG
ncbi:MAG: cellulase family glycosylhydrolase, partial [Candidatus Thiodiazotropha sp.]